MITFNKNWLFIIASSFALGLILGIVWRLPSDQTMNLAFLMAGLLVGVIGVAATLWASSRERELRYDEIKSDISETRTAVASLREMAAQVWQPELPANLNQQPRAIANAVSETVGQAVEGIADDLDETIARRMTSSTGEIAARGGALGEEEISALKQSLQSDVRDYAKSLAGEIQLMMRVAQLTMLSPAERYLVKELVSGPARVNEWGVVDPRKSGFALSSIGPAKDHLISVGIVQAQSAGHQAVVQLSPGWTEAIGQYESMYGPMHVSGAEGVAKEGRAGEAVVHAGGEDIVRAIRNGGG